MAEALIVQAQIQGLRTAVEGRLRADPGAPGGTPAQVPWKPGEQVTATVEAQRPGDRYLLRAGQFLFDVALPVQPQLGERLRLQFLASTPRVTFALAAEDGAPVANPGASTGSAPVEISTSARNLAALVQSLRGAAASGAGASTASAAAPPGTSRVPSLQASAPQAQSAQPATPQPILTAQPLLSAPPADASLLAAALRSAIEDSGVFYESHLKQWLAGERPTQALLREPQGRLLQPVLAAATTATPDETAPQAARASGIPAPSALNATAPVRSDAVDPQLAAQVRLQIETLDARQVVWQGQPWPGQHAQWQIDEPPQRDAGGGADLTWTSRLRLVLPNLGEIDARFSLQAHGLSLRLEAAEAGSQGVLRAAQSDLIQALERAGLQLTAFSVEAAAEPDAPAAAS